MVAQPGSLDSSFGSGGKVITSLRNFGDRCQAMAIQGDGKIVLGGTSQSSFTTSDFVLLRFQSNGAPDSAFGNSGKVITPIEKRSLGNAVTIQNDGKILLAGASNWYVNVARYESNGRLDSSFGFGGTTITDVSGYYSEKCTSMGLQSNGKIVLAGYAQHNSNDQSYFLLLRYHNSGILDSSFGSNGVAIGPAGNCNAIAILANDKILVAGSSGSSIALAGYNANGTLDSSFGVNGIAHTTLGSAAEGNSLAIQVDGKILLGGFGFGASNAGFALLRYHANGILDTAFGIGGKVFTHLGNASAKGNALGIQNDGKILLAGFATNDSNYNNFAMARYQLNGTLDNTFGVGGITITPVGISYSNCHVLGIQNDGKILLAGDAYNGSKLDIAMLRFHGDAVTGTYEIPTQMLQSRVFPNPFNAFAILQCNRPLQQAVLKIYNVQGQLVLQKGSISGREIAIARHHLPFGIYFLQLMEENRVVAVHKLVVGE